MRGFEFAMDKEGNKQYKESRLPVYATKKSACADFFCAEDVKIPSIWDSVKNYLHIKHHYKENDDEAFKDLNIFNPTLVHTGVKALMEDDEVLEIYTRSSMPKKTGTLLANAVGIIDADYYGNPDNDGEIMFAYYNLRPWSVTFKAGDKVGQGMFKKVLRPNLNAMVKDYERTGGFGSTDKR